MSRDTSAGDVDYERSSAGYAVHRRADPRIAAHLHAALGDAESVVNVGAGAGSYEPADRTVTAVEPSAAMRAQRPATAQSCWRFVDPQATEAALACLAGALRRGEWDQRHGALRTQPTFEGSLRLVTAWPAAR